MTPDEIGKKLVAVDTRWQNIHSLSMRELEFIIDDSTLPEKKKLLYKLERNHRINGGEEPMLIIMKKFALAHKRTINRATIYTIP